MQTEFEPKIAPSDHPDHDLLALRIELDSLKQDRLREQEVAMETIARKTAEIGVQRIKIKQYEFALQEALLFLAKPLGKYDEWIDSQSNQDLVFDFARNIPVKYYSALPVLAKQNSETVADARHAQSVSDKQPPNQNNNEKAVLSVKIENSKDMTDLEVNCMESMRLCFNFLRNCQKLNQAIDSGTVQIPKEAISNAEENESLALMSPSPVLDAMNEFDDIKIDTKLVKSQSLTPSKLSIGTPKSSRRNYDNELASGDMSLEPLSDFKSNTTPAKTSQCDNCHKTLLLLDTFKDKLKESEIKNIDLQSRLHKEISARKICQRAKEMIDKEIEDITAELFARANQMVIDESKRMDALTTSNRELSKKTKDLQFRLKEKEMELSKSAAILYDLQTYQIQDKSFVGGNHERRPSLKPSSLLPTIPTDFKFSIVSGFDNFSANIAADGFIFQEFQDFMKVMVLSANMPTLLAVQAIHSSAFMRRSMFENVEPCLNYSYAPTNAFKQIGTSHNSAFKKKLLESVVKGHVQMIRLVEVQKVKCLMCGIPRTCEYKIIIGADPANTSCRSCRDRVIFCQDFFNFVTFLSTGKHTSTILATFKQIMWMRRRMGLAVVGSCSLFESEVSSILGPGAGGIWETDTKAMY